ncbi:MAG: EamA family transporter [Acetobacteraceae bacterium]|nr:EamA family transporter [Acetobacteraceae bacterium]MCX7684918.1 EamA family transporter [Acetobacteraceae bacterium]MDW8396926.1 EamA family transporter [Acetobacteraceae bacterium]
MVVSALWLPFTLSAALFQAWRTAMQQRLRGRFSVNGASLARFLYGAPFALLALLLHRIGWGGAIPDPNAAFWLWVAAGGLAQIVATNLLILAFGHRNFVVGTAYSKTDAVQGAFLAWILLAEALSPLSWMGVFVSVAGTLVLSLAGRAPGWREMVRATFQPAALCGLGAGLLFALTGIFIKLAVEALPAEEAGHIRRALMTVVCMTIVQTLMLAAWMLRKEAAMLVAVLREWRLAMPVGLLSAAGSVGWFSAYALAPIALVRSVGQMEILFTLGFGRFYLREALTRAELVGALLVVGGVVLVLSGAM